MNGFVLLLRISSLLLLRSPTTAAFAPPIHHIRQRTITAYGSALTATSETDSYSFFDQASIYVRAGSGGQGASTYKNAKKGQNGIPDGGSGGTGGSVYLEASDASDNTLSKFHGSAVNEQQHVKASRSVRFRAETGHPGGRMYDNGKRGEDCIVTVPPGTVVCIQRDIADGDQSDSVERIELGTLALGDRLLVAKGGAGGEGTAVLKGKSKGATRRGPQGGERHQLLLTLKIVADVALVGVPNAGKSTFLAAVTRARPKIANYPFTTVVPNLGVWIPSDLEQQQEVVLCDVPGLIAGAADGVGLGHAFLRHVERCRVILHLVDASGEDPVSDFQMIQEEIRRYGAGSLAKKPQVVVVNKIDVWEKEGAEMFEQKIANLQAKLKDATGHSRIMWVSAKERQNMDGVMTRVASYVTKIKDAEKEQVM